jgi:hypothetical protein
MGSIGQKGFSTKDYQVNQGGSGLGVYNAKRMLAGWSGFLEFAKKDGRGALVRITLPCSEAPNWIVGEIDSSRLSKVVIVDDDPKQLAFWTQKIQGELSRDMPIEIVYHQSIAEFMPMIPYYNQYRTSCLYIVDYDFAGERMNGLDLIIEQNLKSHAILCTDRDRDVRLQKSCIEASIQMLPKVLAPFSVWNPFNTTSTKFPVSTESSCRKIVLLDDDELIHILWRYWAEENKIDLTLFKKSGDLLSRLDTLSKDCHLYIDFHLGHENPNGAEIARILYDKGYRNLHICTGDELALGDSRDFVLSVRGKQPPSIF